MDYEKAYKEALKRAKGFKTDEYKDVAEYIFPELAKSEDVMIKEKIIATIHLYYGEPLEDEAKEMIAWLEKQGERKSADKVEPKFEIEEGKWYVCIRDLLDNYANKAFCKGDIYLSTQNGSLIPSNSNVPFEVVCPDTYFKDWTIQDAKPGDVLEFGDHGRLVVGIVSYINKTTGKVDVNCLLENNNFKVGNYYNLDTIKPHPATKEQRDLLFQKMHEAGYEWDYEKLELKKVEQSIAWSEGDFNRIEDALWHTYATDIATKLSNKVKSLRPQSRWKPSTLQIEALESATENCAYSEYQDCLRELAKQLKKL